MGKLKPVELSEQALEDYIVNNPSDVEEGFEVIDRQWPTDSGPLDILGVDGEGILVIVELKAKENDGQLLQGLRYYDYIASNIVSIVKHLESRRIFVLEEEPRLMLIAPSFSQTLMKVAKYIDVDLDLKEYQAFELSSGDIYIYFRSIEIEERREPKIYPTLEEKLSFIEREDIRDLARAFLEELKKLGCELKMVHDEWISLKYAGKRIAAMGCKKKFFVIETQTEEGWKRFRVQDRDDYEKYLNMLKEKIKNIKLI